MEFNPKIEYDNTVPDDCCAPKLGDAACQNILELVERRQKAYLTGDRKLLDSTYNQRNGSTRRDLCKQSENYERMSYYDWYQNQIEYGLNSQIREIKLRAVYDLGRLPFKHNADWSGDQPELELVIVTEESQITCYISRQQTWIDDDPFEVVIPLFVHPPWKAPILETRGEKPEFNKKKFSKRLGREIGVSFCTWSNFLKGLFKIRAFAFIVNPSEGLIVSALLTDKENFEVTQSSKWNVGEWRFKDFLGTSTSKWPWGHELCDLMREYLRDEPHNYAHPLFDYYQVPRKDFDLLLACVDALQEPDFLKYLNWFELADDFECGVFHARDAELACNFVLPENHDLSVLQLFEDD